MNTITMKDLCNTNDGWDMIGFVVSDWDGNNGDNEFMTWDGYTFIVENGIVVKFIS